MASTDIAEHHYIICKLHSVPERHDEVKALLLELVATARSQPGNLSYHVFQNRDDETTFHIVDGWDSADTYQNHHDSEEVADVVSRLNPLLTGAYTEEVTQRFSD